MFLGLSGAQDYVVLFTVITAAVTVLAIVLSIPITDIVWKYAPYAYPMPRAKAVEAECFERDDIEEMVEGDLRDVIAKVEARVEPETVRKLLDEKDPKPLELELKRDAVRSLLEVAESSPEGTDEVVRALTAKYELEDVKAVIRAHHAGVEPKNLVDEPVLLPSSVWHDIKRAATLAEVIDLLQGTPYDDGSLEEAFREYEDTGNLFVLESALDRAYYSYLWDVVVTEKAKEELFPVLGIEVDLYNVEVAIRGIFLGLTPEERERAMADGGWELLEWRKRELAQAEDVTDVVETLSGTSLGPFLEEAREEYMEEKDPRAFDKALRKARYELVSEILETDLIGAPAVVSAVYAKQKDVDNVVSIVNAKLAGVEPLVVL